MKDPRLPRPVSEIAEAANLNERYVREWLGRHGDRGRLVELRRPPRITTTCPPAHAACLTRDAAPDNMAAFAQYIPLFGTVEDGIVRLLPKRAAACLIPPFPRFQTVMAEDSGQTVLPALAGTHPSARSQDSGNDSKRESMSSMWASVAARRST